MKELEKALASARKLGASAAKVLYRASTREECSFEAGRLKTSEVRETVSYTIEVLAGGRRGVASGNTLADIEEMAARACTLARMGSVAHFAVFPPPGTLARVRRYFESTVSLSLERMIETGSKIVEALAAYDKTLYIAANALRSRGSSALFTTGGVRYESQDTSWSLGAEAQRTQDTDILFAWKGRSWRELSGLFDPSDISGSILLDLQRSERIVETPQGKVPVFLEPEGFSMLLYPLMLGVNGRNVAKGDSPLRGRIGEQLLDPSLTVIDDPHLDGSQGAAEIDNDGIPTRKNRIIDGGRLERFLYDLDSAAMAGAEPTGNNHCRPYSLEVPAGDMPEQELMATIDDGLYVKGLIGFGQSNIMNGDFSSNVALGFRIQRGKITGRVKNTMIAGNVYELLKSGIRLSRERDPILRLPSVVIQGVSASAGAAGR